MISKENSSSFAMCMYAYVKVMMKINEDACEQKDGKVQTRCDYKAPFS